MIGKLNHIAIAVPDLDAAVAKYRDLLGANVSTTMDLPEHGVRVVFVELENSKIELMTPLGDNSPIAKFLEKTPTGGTHHICFEVKNINVAIAKLVQGGARLLGNGKTKIGAHGLPVVFLHPKDFDGVLIELEQVGS